MPPFNARSWKQLVARLAPGARFNSPAADALLVEAERALGVPLPEQLRELLREADGIEAVSSEVVWSVADIVARNSSPTPSTAIGSPSRFRRTDRYTSSTCSDGITRPTRANGTPAGSSSISRSE